MGGKTGSANLPWIDPLNFSWRTAKISGIDKNHQLRQKTPERACDAFGQGSAFKHQYIFSSRKNRLEFTCSAYSQGVVAIKLRTYTDDCQSRVIPPGKVLQLLREQLFP